MRLAVLADIHGNLSALEAVINDMERMGGIEKVWVLGDLSAFGPRPAACIRRVQEIPNVEVIQGNTDRYLLTGERHPMPPTEDEETFKTLSQNWYERDLALNWAVGKLTFADYEYLRKLGTDLSLKVDGYGYVVGYHAVPGDDEGWLHPDTSDEAAADALLDREGRLGIGGHTHTPMDREVRGWRLLNPGSVGAPRAGKGAEYAVINFVKGEKAKVDLRTVAFDVKAVIADYETAGAPVPEWMAKQMHFKVK